MKYLDGSENYIKIAIICGVVFVIAGIAGAFIIYNKFFR